MLWEGGDPAGISGWSHRLWPRTEKELPGSTALLVPEQDRCLPYAQSIPGRPPGLWRHLAGRGSAEWERCGLSPHTEHQGHILSCLRKADQSRLLPLPTR